jgi:hypothetical protein
VSRCRIRTDEPRTQIIQADDVSSGAELCSCGLYFLEFPRVPIPAPIPKAGIGAGIGKASFSLISRGRRAAHASRPPALSTRKLGKVRGVGK